MYVVGFGVRYRWIGLADKCLGTLLNGIQNLREIPVTIPPRQ
jgi:hypothetical protein